MFSWKFWLPLPLVLHLGTGFALPHLTNSEAQQSDYSCLRPSEWLQHFQRAVERGELILFANVLTREQILPREVEQRYVLDSGMQTIVIHADLVQPQGVPGHDAVEVRRISSELDLNGQIIETRAHVYPRPAGEEAE